MSYDIPAKPTKYNGRLYRSRLEARVAAFFDLMDNIYEYEPFDLPGWSPDFLINPSEEMRKRGIIGSLVEVKPKANMFDIRKYLKVDFDQYAVLFICPESIIYLSKEACFSIELEHGTCGIAKNWIEAANKVMFLKPESNG
jgi:hypothetical protein